MIRHWEGEQQFSLKNSKKGDLRSFVKEMTRVGSGDFPKQTLQEILPSNISLY